MTDSHSTSSESSKQVGKSQTVAEITELAGGLAHELHNPLSTVMVNLKLLAETLEDPDVSAEDLRRRALIKVDVIRREGARLQRLLEEFLQMAGPVGLNPSRVDLRKVADEWLAFVTPELQDYGIDTVVEHAEMPLICEIDQHVLRQALVNLVRNAREAMPSGGTLALRTSRENGRARLDLSDTGVGISEADGERIFRPFFTSKSGGSGLGLSITRRLVEEHDGALRVSSVVGEGSTFTILLPLVETE